MATTQDVIEAALVRSIATHHAKRHARELAAAQRAVNRVPFYQVHSLLARWLAAYEEMWCVHRNAERLAVFQPRTPEMIRDLAVQVWRGVPRHVDEIVRWLAQESLQGA